MSTGKIQFAEQDGTFVLKFVGEVRLTLCSALDATIEVVRVQPLADGRHYAVGGAIRTIQG